MDRVDKYPFCQTSYTPIMPLVYEDALSYIETLGQMANKINEVIEAITNISSETLDMANSYTDGKVAEALVSIEKAVEDVELIRGEIIRANEEFKTAVNSKIGAIEYDFDKLKEKTTADYLSGIIYTNNAITQNNEYLLTHLESELSKVKVLNYFTGEMVSVQDMFDYLARFHLTNAISVNTLVSRRKTVNQLVALNMTLTDLATNGGTLITA